MKKLLFIILIFVLIVNVIVSASIYFPLKAKHKAIEKDVNDYNELIVYSYINGTEFYCNPYFLNGTLLECSYDFEYARDNYLNGEFVKFGGND